MGSDDDLLDVYDGDSGEDYYYNGGEDEDSDMAEHIDGGDDEDNDADYGYASDDLGILRSEEMADKPQNEYSGYLVPVDNNSAVAEQSKGPTTTNYESTNKLSNYDKQSGSYTRGTAKESYSSGDYSNCGRVGYKDQYKTSSAARFGDERGYTEYYKQEKVTRVEYDTTTSSSYSGGSNNYGAGGKVYKSYGGGKNYGGGK